MKYPNDSFQVFTNKCPNVCQLDKYPVHYYNQMAATDNAPLHMLNASLCGPWSLAQPEELTQWVSLREQLARFLTMK